MSIIKSNRDNRTYEYFVLDNGMKVMLVNDYDATISGVSLGVEVGYFSDSIAGTAHFLEHLLFMGSHKYPNENYYTEFITQNGGTQNAFTSERSTTYYHSICSEHLLESLDIFSRFFIDPLLSESAIDRELNAVHAEYEMHKLSDYAKQQNLLKKITNSQHPFSKFGCGNKSTLSDPNIIEYVRQFHSNFYSSDIMNLCIVTNMNLYVLKKFVVEIFNNVVNKNVRQNITDNYCKIFNKTNFVIEMVPTTDTHRMNIFWQMPTDDHHYNYNPITYISHLLGHECEGSLLDILIKKGYAFKVCADQFNYRYGDQILFSLDITLTEEGLENYTKVENLVYDYIHLIKTNGITEDFYDDIILAAHFQYEYSKKLNAMSYVLLLIHDMMDNKYKPIEKILIKSTVNFDNFAKYLIDEQLKYMDKYNSITVLSSKSLANNAMLYDELFDTYYYMYYNENDHIMKLPAKNQFVPLIGDGLIYDEENGMVLSYQGGIIKIYIRDKFKLYCKSALQYVLPCCSVICEMTIGGILNNHKKYVTLCCLVEYVMLSLSSDIYYATTLGYNCSMNVVDNKIVIKCYGFTDKMKTLFDIIINKLFSKEINDNTLQLAKSSIEDDLKYKVSTDVYDIAHRKVCEKIKSCMPNVEQQLDMLNYVKCNDISNFFDDKSISVVGITCGNINEELTIELFYLLNIKCNREYINQEEPYLNVLEKDIINKTTQFADNPNDNNFASSVFYQIEHIDSSSSEYYDLLGALKFIGTVIYDAFFDDLRTKQQLGYLVSANVEAIKIYKKKLLCMVFIVQSPCITSASVLTSRIEEFIRNYYDILQNMDDGNIEMIKNGLIKKLTKPCSNIEEEISLTYVKVCEDDMEYVDKLMSCIKKLTKTMIIDIYKKYMIDNCFGKWIHEIDAKKDEM